VTPGFVDIHTHYDGQISWDEEMEPSSRSGVTTCVMGNCGVGFAPVRDGDEARLIALMEGVEDIPGSALAAGLTWDWNTFPEYMDAIDRVPHTIDFAAQVPHDALRMYVMGERALAEEKATTDDVETMQRLVREALEAGAVGLSTGRTDNHRTASGSATPASEAMANELIGLASAFEGLGRGVLEAVSDFDYVAGADRYDGEFALLKAMAKRASRPMSLSLLQRDQCTDQWRRILKSVEEAKAEGITMHVQVAGRAIGIMLGLEATFHPFMGFPSYKAISHLPLKEQVVAMRDPERKRAILSEKSEPVAGDGSAIPPLADQLLAHIDMIAMRLYRLDEHPNYEPEKKTCVYAEALAKKVTVLEAVYDALLEDPDGKTLLYFPLYNYGSMNLDCVGEMLAHPQALVGLSDAGAHVGTVCDGSMPLFLLQHWAKDDRGPSLQRLVQMQAAETAAWMGFSDRGTLEVGKRADINIFDLNRLRLRKPRMVTDLPGGGKRLLQDADGVIATFVAGQAIAENGTLTGARPGRLVRGG
ncbi:MAG: amidohydrolase family protein, partial [Myxococcota bacterium]